MINHFFHSFFSLDALGIIMIIMVVFTGACVGSFAYRYMRGDAKYRTFFLQFFLLLATILLMVSTDQMVVLFCTWCASNLLLVRLMIHKTVWRAAKASGIVASRNYLFGASCLAVSFIIFYWITGETSIQALHKHTESKLMLPALVLLLVAAMTQSSIWPFHRWLLSSLNSPTPVSAIMHAGLINGGGFILTRFAPLYLHHSSLLNMIFILGIITSLLGTLWKLMQSNVKSMLACSTMGQMGFMLMQCGLGIFPAAVAHLVWHGMFKAYLFLASGSAFQERRFDTVYLKPSNLAGALICGMVGSFGFSFSSGKSWLAGDATLVLMVVAFLSASQFVLPMLQNKIWQKLPIALVVTWVLGLGYGGSVRLIAQEMEPLQLMQPQPLNVFHILGIVVLILTWLAMLYLRNQNKTDGMPAWFFRNYVKALNASQPHPETITAHRNHYQYL